MRTVKLQGTKSRSLKLDGDPVVRCPSCGQVTMLDHDQHNAAVKGESFIVTCYGQSRRIRGGHECLEQFEVVV